MRGIYLFDACEDEHLDDDSADGEAKISLNAMPDTCTLETKRLLRLCVGSDSHYLGRLQLHSLLHGGSSCSSPEPDPHDQGWHDFRVANGERLPCLGIFSVPSFSIDGEPFCIDFLIIALEGYKKVLGCNWLHTLEPIVWDVSCLSVVSWWLDHQFMWIGLGALYDVSPLNKDG
jgi:hypothetical protein